MVNYFDFPETPADVAQRKAVFDHLFDSAPAPDGWDTKREEGYERVLDAMYGGTAPECPGHVMGKGNDAKMVWCDFLTPCTGVE